MHISCTLLIFYFISLFRNIFFVVGDSFYMLASVLSIALYMKCEI